MTSSNTHKAPATVQPIDKTSPEAQSADLVQGNVAQLKTIFPEAFTEGRVDFDVLKQLLGAAVDEREEKYGLNWHGKRRARQLALTPSTGTLRPCPQESVDWDTTQNLFIEGDNLEVLKLLQKSYAGKVKLIYIDPPYNTGKDFVYPDNFQDSIKNYLELTGQVEGGQKISSNTEASGRFHTDWLNMMYPRLKLARPLLRADGAIFVSCDEGEHTRLRLIMDEVFGGENFVGDLVWAAGRKNDSRLVSISHEYIVCYAADAAELKERQIEWRQRKKGLDAIYAQFDSLRRQHGEDFSAITRGMKAWFSSLEDSNPSKAHKHYAYADRRGLYFPDNISWPGGGGPQYEVLHPTTKRPVKIPSRGWMTSDPAKLQAWISDDRVHFGPDETTVPCIKSYLRDKEFSTPYSVFYQDGRGATKRLRELMGDDVFDFPKDEAVLQEIVEMVTSDDDVVLDFFAGSGTIAHAVALQNAADGGRRRFIAVQLPEPLDPEKENQQAGAKLCRALGRPMNIAELAKERIRRVLERTKQASSGFKVFKLDASNIRAWTPQPDDLAASLLDSAEHLVSGRTDLDVLYELLLKLGLSLTVPIESREVAGKTVYCIGAGALFACLSDGIARETAEPLALGLADWQKTLAPAGGSKLVFKDSAFADDVAKTNLAAILSQHGLDDVRSL